MEIIESILNVITSDSSINELATGGIRYEHLPVDFDRSLDWIVFSYKFLNEEKVNTDSTKRIIEYALDVQIISPDIDNVVIISDYLYNYLTNYDDNENVRDITMTDSDASYDLEYKVYYKTQTYNILFIRNK